AALAWVAAAPLMVASRAQGPWRGALLGLVAGCGFHYGLLSWAGVFGVPAQVALVLVKAFGMVLLGAVLGACPCLRSPVYGALFGACAWVGMEYFQMLGPFGTTCGMLSHSQARVLPLIQVGELVGPWGLSWVIALVNASVAEAFLLWRARRPVAGVRWAAGLSLLMIVLLWGFGVLRLHRPWGQGPSVVWGVVQISMPQNERWDPVFRETIMGRLESQTRQAAAAGARIVAWPETSIPYTAFLQTLALRLRVGGLAMSTGTWILAGSIEMADQEPGATRNVASLIGPDGDVAETCDKIRLVPFGEYLPLPRAVRDWKVFDRVMRYLPGTRQVVFRAHHSPEVPFGVLICYESMVPHEPRRKVELGAQVLTVITNDAWFEKSSAAMHHFEMAVMRAVEMRRPVVHCGNNGISGFIDATGRVLKQSRLDEIVTLTETVRGETYRTLYSRIGDVFAYLCILALGVLWKGARVR
ncbi:MAG: apolipoprotein N-acyltransferase, partial [Candidatus Eremiobacterota bacterium]